MTIKRTWVRGREKGDRLDKTHCVHLKVAVNQVIEEETYCTLGLDLLRLK